MGKEKRGTAYHIKATGSHLTPREKEIISLFQQGLNREEVRARLNIACSSLTQYLSNLREYYHLDTIPELITHFQEQPRDNT